MPRRTEHALRALALACSGAVAFGGVCRAGNARGRRVNHERRILPALPRFGRPTLFNTPEADRILSSVQVFPPDSPWNEDVSRLPVHPDSDRIVARAGREKRLAFNLDMCFVIVPPNQPKVEVELTAYPDESDPGPYPVPANAPVEGWPLHGGALGNIQREGTGDRHVIVVEPWGGRLFEFFSTRLTDAGWTAACAAVFDLDSNKLRPAGWTSTDAAGLPIFPAVVRYDECERGRVEHALRVTFRKTRRAYVYPARHYASRLTDADVPAMGQRLRLRANVETSHFPRHARAVAYALKKYGMFVADNGGDWRISVAPDSRLAGLDHLRKLKGGDFEVVRTTGEKEGPRARRR
jgi:hypothetical protein